MDGLGLGHVEQLRAELLQVAIGQVGDLARVAYGAHDLITLLEQLLADLTSGAAADAQR